MRVSQKIRHHIPRNAARDLLISRSHGVTLRTEDAVFLRFIEPELPGTAERKILTQELLRLTRRKIRKQRLRQSALVPRHRPGHFPGFRESRSAGLHPLNEFEVLGTRQGPVPVNVVLDLPALEARK